MRIFTCLFLVLYLAVCTTELVAQENLSNLDSPVQLEYVVAQEVGSSTLGSFVIKNNYPSRNLGEHVMAWELYVEGILLNSDVYRLGEIEPNSTKYISLRKLFDLHMLDELGNGLISMYAEIQDTQKGANPIRIVGESAVLAEARKVAKPEPAQYQIIKVAGASIYRIAGGNSITLDIYNQIVGLDLGKGNVLAGPIRPVIQYDTAFAKTTDIHAAQHLIDSLGPTSIRVEEDALEGILEYDLNAGGILKLSFGFGESGLQIGTQLFAPTLPPNHIGLDVPLRNLGDSVIYLGHQLRTSAQPAFGDTRLGKYGIQLDTPQTGIKDKSTIYSNARSISSARGVISGDPFAFQLKSVVNNNTGKNEITRHSMEDGTYILSLEREVEKPYRAVNTKPLRGGTYQFRPLLEAK